ncbi:hypothetical protein L210DRAFT_3509995 [Boletus edulis BED1]|uniref:Uncharacterized protein n=1 Tax=Boletus edulis BED1 TaxID=1328754 RepID=A0AAD4G6K7_BOLED|nr:hypothetical protein L210DRAFT_3509995 [Boletus edulis BED1]
MVLRRVARSQIHQEYSVCTTLATTAVRAMMTISSPLADSDSALPPTDADGAMGGLGTRATINPPQLTGLQMNGFKEVEEDDEDVLKQVVEEPPDVATADNHGQGHVASKSDKRNRNGLSGLYLQQVRLALLGIGAKEREPEDDDSRKKKSGWIRSRVVTEVVAIPTEIEGRLMNEIVQGTVETTGNFDGPIMNPSIANFTRVSYSGSWVSEPAFGGFVKAEDTGVWPVPWTNGAMARRPTKEWGENAGCQTHDVEVSLRICTGMVDCTPDAIKEAETQDRVEMQARLDDNKSGELFYVGGWWQCKHSPRNNERCQSERRKTSRAHGISAPQKVDSMTSMGPVKGWIQVDELVSDKDVFATPEQDA